MFYKMDSESLDGEDGYFYCEVINGMVVKQLHVYGDKMYWATEREHNNSLYFFTEKPEFDIDLIEINFEEISEEAFISIWNSAKDYNE